MVDWYSLRARVAGVAAGIGALGACGGRAAPLVAARSERAVTAFEVVAAVDRLSPAPAWPGFDARRVPLAIYDGQATLLVRHPRPPDGFRPHPGYPSALVFAGRYPALRANTSADVGGVRTATLLLDPTRGRTADEWAATAIHEAFHVFQRERHPRWTANEADLFVYPMGDRAQLELRRVETEALRRALAAPAPRLTRCWAAAALLARRERFAGLDSAAVAYERGTELNEGLANYVERRASGRPMALPAADFAPDAVRERSYMVGAALGALLDRVRPAWRDTLEAGDARPLDVVLGAALAGAAPLFPQGFDPLNVSRVRPAEVLHARFLTLGSAAGTLEALDRASLTEGPAHGHPLFSGVRRVSVTGLPAQPMVRDSAGTAVLSAAGLRLAFRGATVSWAGDTVRVRIP